MLIFSVTSKNMKILMCVFLCAFHLKWMIEIMTKKKEKKKREIVSVFFGWVLGEGPNLG